MTTTEERKAELLASLGVRLEATMAEQFARLARERGDVPAVIDASGSLTFAELDAETNRLARLLADRGASAGDRILISTPIGSLLAASAIAAWKIGSVPMPVSDRMVQRELDALIELGTPAVAVDSTDRTMDVPRVRALEEAAELSSDPLEPIVAPHLKAPTSGGSTGRPKLIVSGSPGDPESLVLSALLMGVPVEGVSLITAALSHNAPFSDALASLALGSTTVIMERFDPEAVLQLTEQHRVTWIYAVPAMMQRIWRLPEETRATYDMSSVRTLLHVAAPCPPWLKHAFIDWLGADRILELYGPTEGQAATTIRGEEWLEREGSVGTAKIGQISIRDEEGNELPTGTIGEVWLRREPGSDPAYHYLGATAETAADGWETVGDMGRLDEDGYLYLSDRRGDMILVGGVNVYPAEIEAAAAEHPNVFAAAAVGIDHEEMGKVPALVIETNTGEVPDGFEDFLAERLGKSKRPRTITATTKPLRDPAGKIRKREIHAEYFGD